MSTFIQQYGSFVFGLLLGCLFRFEWWQLLAKNAKVKVLVHFDTENLK